MFVTLASMYLFKLLMILKLVIPVKLSKIDNKVNTMSNYKSLHESNNPNAYGKIDKSHKVDILKNGKYERVEDKEIIVTTHANIMINEGDQVRLPCITHNNVEAYESRVLVEIKETTGNWTVRCQYGEDTRVCKAEGDEEAYSTIGLESNDEIIVELEVHNMGSYECTIIGSRGCTINGKEYLCRSHKHRVIITVMPLNDNPPPEKVIGVGSLMKMDKNTIPCGRGFASYEPAEMYDNVVTGLVETTTLIYKGNESSSKRLIGECNTNTFGRVTCKQDNIIMETLDGESEGKVFELEIIGKENNVTGTYMCQTQIENSIDKESLCTNVSKEKGIWTINMWKCKELIQKYQWTIYKNMEDMSIESVPISGIANTTLGFDYLVKTNSSGDDISCVIQTEGKTLQEFEEVDPEGVKSDTVLRCCVHEKGCNQVHPWVEHESIGFKWVIYPIQTGRYQEGNLLKLRAKSPGSTTLYGLCSQNGNKSEEHEVLIKAIIVVGFMTAAILIFLLHLMKIRKNKYILAQKEHIHMTYKSEAVDLEPWDLLDPPAPHGC